MPLVEPKSHHDTFFALAVGISLVLTAWVITRSTLPHTGDNIHSLPHGGHYRDGSKQITYCRPTKNHGHTAAISPWWALLLAISLPALIFFIERRHPDRLHHSCPLHPLEPTAAGLPNNPDGGINQYSGL
uniref:TGB2 n=1 Tax=Agave potexvirus 1 TaxID=2794411 RepID=A0A7T5UFT9_9VIRU|nr:TGB2 [Agave potexvirus 1]